MNAHKKESIKVKKYPDLAGELKRLWNIKVAVTPIVVGILEIVPKVLERRLEEMEIRGRIDTTQTTAQLKSARVLRRIQSTRREFLLLHLQ